MPAAVYASDVMPCMRMQDLDSMIKELGKAWAKAWGAC